MCSSKRDTYITKSLGGKVFVLNTHISTLCMGDLTM